MALDTLSKAIGDTIDLSVGDIVAKFGGDKRAIALAAQKGEIDPTKAVMAGMAVDRVVASAAQPQNTTVAEDVLAQQQPAGLGAMAPQMGQPQMPPQAGMGGPSAAPPPQGGQGLNKVPVPQRGFADGGIVGFQAGGQPSLRDILSQMSYMELQDYQRTGRLPEKYRTMLPEAQPSFINSLKQQEDQRNQLISNIPMEPSAPPPALPTAAPPSGDMAPGLNPNIDDQMGVDTGQQAGLGAIAPKPPAEPRKTSDQYATEAKSMFDTLYGDYARGLTKPDREAMGVETIDYLERSGVDLSLASKQAARLAEERKEIAGDRKEAANLRLIEAGLGILGGESPYAFVNIGKGAAPAVKGFAQDIKDIKKAQRDLDRSKDQLEVAQNQMNMGVASMTQNRFDKKSEAYDKAQMDMQKAKGDLAVKLMTNDNARDIVTMQMQKKSAYEMARDDYVAGGGKASDFSRAYIGKSKAGAMTQDDFDEFAVKEWNRLTASKKREYKKQGIETLEAYKRYLERNRQRGSLLDGSGAAPPLPDNPLRLDPTTLNANR